jgi:peroxiredoxin Q/BCP
MALSVGQNAPPFNVVASSGERVALRDFLGKKNVVLYFYPGDFTHGCTRETCGFRDMYSELASKDTEVIGVSIDSDESHARFAKAYDLPFSLVSDTSRALSKAYEATNLLTTLTGRSARVTYVIDKKGMIAGVFEGTIAVGKHLDGVRDLIKRLG